MAENGTIETVVDGVVEARRDYCKGDYIVLGSRGGRYPMTASEFASRYHTDRETQENRENREKQAVVEAPSLPSRPPARRPTKKRTSFRFVFGDASMSKAPRPARDPALAEEGFELFTPTGKVWIHELSAEDIRKHFPAGRFTGRWGGEVKVDAGDILASPFPSGGEVYLIKSQLFFRTYQQMQLPNQVDSPSKHRHSAKSAIIEQLSGMNHHAAVIHARRHTTDADTTTVDALSGRISLGQQSLVNQIRKALPSRFRQRLREHSARIRALIRHRRLVQVRVRVRGEG